MNAQEFFGDEALDEGSVQAAGPRVTAERRRVERRSSVVDRRSGLARRRGPGRRRSDSRRSAEEGELTPEQFGFVMAMDEYKRANKRPFPSWTEVLEVIKYLGYRKVAEVGQHVDRPAADPK
jgi:hypothetical protein